MTITSDGGIRVNIESFGRHLRPANLSPTTIKTYVEAAQLPARFLGERRARREDPPRARRSVHHGAARTLEADDGDEPLPRLSELLQVADRRRRDQRVADGEDEGATCPGRTAGGPARARAES